MNSAAPVGTPKHWVEGLRTAKGEDEIIEASARAAWQIGEYAGPFTGQYVPTNRQLAMWLRKRQKGRFRLDPEYFADTRSNWRWQCENVHRDSTAQRLILAEETLDDTKVALHQNAVEYAHMRWVGRIAKFTEVEIQELISSREVLHPLIPLVIFWLKEAYVSPVDPDRRPSGILPAPFARRAEAELLPHLLIGLYVGPKRIQLPRHGRVTVLERLVVELILSVPQKNRPKTRKRKGKVDSDSDDVVAQFALDFQVKEIVDWLQWSKAAYRRTGATTGKLLRRVIEDELSNIRLPIGPRGGGLYPCRMVFASGWTLRDRVAFSVTLPSGSYVGPPVDRQMLRDLGGDGPAWRAYLSLCCYWDRHGGEGGSIDSSDAADCCAQHAGPPCERKGKSYYERNG